MTLFSVPEQQSVVKRIDTVVQQFKKSKGKIRPHFLLTGPTGTGKTANVCDVTEHHKMDFLEINAAQLTAEGLSGNSLSKAFKGLENMQNKPVVCLVDEADKLFTNGSGGKSSNGSIDVQNEFLKILESDSMSVIGDYGHYNEIKCNKVLYVFAGAFGGVENIGMYDLAKMGMRPEFVGRLAATFEMPQISLESYLSVAKNHDLLKEYVRHNAELAEHEDTLIQTILDKVEDKFDTNGLGLRMVGNTIHEVMIDELIKLN